MTTNERERWLYVTENGAKSVARKLNQGGWRTRSGDCWSKSAVLAILDQPAIAGTLYWGRHHRRMSQKQDDWLELKVPPIVDAATYALACELRVRREPGRAPGKAAARPHLLTGLLRCGNCGSSLQLETSGKKTDGNVYRYCYYNCRAATRSGVEA